MANILEHRDKQGKLKSFYIRVFRGRDRDGKQLNALVTTFEVKPTWTEETARKKAAAFAAKFEAECRSGLTANTRQKFAEYADYVLELKEQREQIKHSTLVRYRELTKRIYPEIGHIKLADLRADHLNTLYTKLGEKGNKKTAAKAKAKIDLAAILKDKGFSKASLSRQTGIAPSSVSAIIRGDVVKAESAKAIAKALNISFDKSFTQMVDNDALSAKTVLEHHRLISAVLEQAVKEGLIPFNVAARATLPKVEKKKVNYFQPEQVNAIRDALETEQLKWKTLVHLFLITGARRGEILGLKWSAVDFNANRIHIENSILYSPDRGIYEDTPKTETSIRWISLPSETMQLLREWKNEQYAQWLMLGSYYTNNGFVFCQNNGLPMHPDSVTDWMKKFSARHGLPHINPHAFRHTMASMLYFHNVDSISISKRLGHAQPSTTTNIYAHIIEEADQRNADILADIFLKKANA